MNFLKKWKANRNSKILLELKKDIDANGISEDKQNIEIVKLKNDEKVLLCYPVELNDCSIIVRLYSILNGDIHCSQMNLAINDNVMTIRDIQVLKPKTINRGYGSLLVSKAIEIAKAERLVAMIGEMSSQSDEQRARQVHFYKKFGFAIDSDHNIRLDLKT